MDVEMQSFEARGLCLELKKTVAELKETGIERLIPEIGANIAYALPTAKELTDIAAIPGRMLRFKGQVATLGEPEMGASTYMGKSLLVLRKYFPSARCIVNLRNNPVIRRACTKLGFSIAHMPVPPGYRQTDADFYDDLHRVLANCQELPDIIEIPDRINLERLILVLGEELKEIEDKIKSLAAKEKMLAQND